MLTLMHLPITTGYSDAVDSEKVKQSGIKAFIPKPCQKQELARTTRANVGSEKTDTYCLCYLKIPDLTALAMRQTIIALDKI